MFKGQKNKMAKILADKGIYIIEEKKYHIVGHSMGEDSDICDNAV